MLALSVGVVIAALGLIVAVLFAFYESKETARKKKTA